MVTKILLTEPESFLRAVETFTKGPFEEGFIGIRLSPERAQQLSVMGYAHIPTEKREKAFFSTFFQVLDVRGSAVNEALSFLVLESKKELLELAKKVAERGWGEIDVSMNDSNKNGSLTFETIVVSFTGDSSNTSYLEDDDISDMDFLSLPMSTKVKFVSREWGNLLVFIFENGSRVYVGSDEENIPADSHIQIMEKNLRVCLGYAEEEIGDAQGRAQPSTVDTQERENSVETTTSLKELPKMDIHAQLDALEKTIEEMKERLAQIRQMIKKVDALAACVRDIYH